MDRCSETSSFESSRNFSISWLSGNAFPFDCVSEASNMTKNTIVNVTPEIVATFFVNTFIAGQREQRKS